ncbi:pyruvate dehydrogenase (acetyl-transferring) E1 component subunit alpha [Neptunomonas antarctica]|uniref:Pyruvate dehydrogenase E1 component subunit alpha n=1 Tax=Neptunomonas antarctica TaxID=619304 RepID=A0A1N7MYY4_9GAMM|nr:pyruvate dehydrogenase (acetyl-transferring) E1 component subunit alpha [Neptunomonas antarctica]SIS91333.1 pyruvate dehydrogenase E1 component alpha subunit [Neptunomonas antarctica]
MNIIYEGQIPFYQFLNEHSQVIQPLPEWALTKETLINYYQQMVIARQFDTKAIALQRTGQLGTYASSAGCEAIDVVTASLMSEADVLVPYYRNHAMQMIRGMELSDILLYWGGDERGNSSPAQREDFPNCVPIATQCLHACGVASAIKIRAQQRATVCMLGDGATSKGDFLEALNVAGVWQLPVVFIINNNQWAISVPRSLQSIALTLAQKALGAGIRGEQVDGNDVIALHQSVASALQRAREGKGPTLIEAVSYRLSDHTTADDATRYRHPDALKTAWEKEPIKRLRNYLHAQGWWQEHNETEWQHQTATLIQASVEQYLDTPPQPVSAMFDYLFADLPEHLVKQRDIAVSRDSGESSCNSNSSGNDREAAS